MWQLHVRPTHARPAAARPQGRLQPPSSTWIRRGWVSPRQRPHLPRALQVQAPSQRERVLWAGVAEQVHTESGGSVY